MINYTPFGHSDWQTIVVRHQEVRLGRQEDGRGLDHQRRRQRAVLQGARQPGRQGRRTFRWLPSRSVKKSSPASTPSRCVGHLAAWNYFQSIKTPKNAEFIKQWKAFTKNPKRVTNDPMEAHVIGFAMWVKAVEKAKSTDPDKVHRRAPGHRSAEPDRRHLEDAAEPPHHQAGVHRRGQSGRPVRRGVEDAGLVPGDAWSKSSTARRIWSATGSSKKCGNFNTKTNKCGGSRLRRRCDLTYASSEAAAAAASTSIACRGASGDQLGMVRSCELRSCAARFASARLSLVVLERGSAHLGNRSDASEDRAGAGFAKDSFSDTDDGVIGASRPVAIHSRSSPSSRRCRTATCCSAPATRRSSSATRRRACSTPQRASRSPSRARRPQSRSPQQPRCAARSRLRSAALTLMAPDPAQSASRPRRRCSSRATPHALPAPRQRATRQGEATSRMKHALNEARAAIILYQADARTLDKRQRHRR